LQTGLTAQPRFYDDVGEHVFVLVTHDVHAGDALDFRERAYGVDAGLLVQFVGAQLGRRSSSIGFVSSSCG
jgi:hypothetical protein